MLETGYTAGDWSHVIVLAVRMLDYKVFPQLFVVGKQWCTIPLDDPAFIFCNGNGSLVADLRPEHR